MTRTKSRTRTITWSDDLYAPRVTPERFNLCVRRALQHEPTVAGVEYADRNAATYQADPDAPHDLEQRVLRTARILAGLTT